MLATRAGRILLAAISLALVSSHAFGVAPETAPPAPPHSPSEKLAPESVFLRYLWREGDKLAYRSFLVLWIVAERPEEGTSVQGTMTAVRSERYQAIRRVEDLLEVAAEADPTRVVLRLGGRLLQRQSSAERLDLELSPQGEVPGWGRKWGLSWEGDETQGLALGKPSLLLAFAPCGTLPADEVKVGDAWSGSKELEMLPLTDSREVLASSRLLEIGRFQGRPCAKVRTTWSSDLTLPVEHLFPFDPSPLSFPSGVQELTGEYKATLTWYFDYVSGRLLQAEGPVLLTLRAETQKEEEEVPTVVFDFAAEGTLKTVLLP